MRGENKKWQRRKTLSSNDKHKFYCVRTFINFCLKSDVIDTNQIDRNVYSRYVQHLKHTLNNNERTILDSCYVVKSFLKKSKCPLTINPWRRYAKKCPR